MRAITYACLGRKAHACLGRALIGAPVGATILTPRKASNAMPTPIFPTAYQVEARGTLFGQLIENVWHVIGPDPFDPTLAADIAATFQTGYANIYASLSQDIDLREIFVHNLNGPSSGEVTLAITPPATGGIVEDGEPGNVAICISLRTALAGRSSRGRKYFSGLTVGDVTGNTVNSVTVGNVLVAVSDLIAALLTNGTPLAIFSPTHLLLTQVSTATAVDFNVDSQRRRLTGRGR
jgi:hypothetical protein